jgi:hypothetical protein
LLEIRVVVLVLSTSRVASFTDVVNSVSIDGPSNSEDSVVPIAGSAELRTCKAIALKL